MIELSQLEELKKIRTDVEEESRSLKEERKECEEMVNVLQEKIAIEQTKKDNKLTRESITQLRSKIDELGQTLKEISQPGEASAPLDVKPEATTEDQKPENEVVTVTALDNSVEIQQEEAVEHKKQEEKKHRFF